MDEIRFRIGDYGLEPQCILDIPRAHNANREYGIDIVKYCKDEHVPKGEYHFVIGTIYANKDGTLYFRPVSGRRKYFKDKDAYTFTLAAIDMLTSYFDSQDFTFDRYARETTDWVDLGKLR